MAGSVMEIVDLREAIEWQARHAEEGGAPNTARMVRGLLALENSDAATARRIVGWQGLSLADAMPLRINGGLHWLALTGEEPRLADIYAGRITDQGTVDALVREAVERHDAVLLPWLDHPPQTNEAGRSASLMAGLHWLAERTTGRFALFEIGSSAGINTMMDRFRFDLGGVEVGPANSPMRLAPEWRGPPPPDATVQIVSIRGCDVAPVDLTDPDAALRLKSYVWPEANERMARIDAAVSLASEQPPDVAKEEAAGFVERALAQASEDGVTRVLLHSIVWQYLPEDQQQRIGTAMAQAGADATSTRPLAWLALETNRETFRHELTARIWPGGAEPALLGCAHPHGAWVEWFE